MFQQMFGKSFGNSSVVVCKVVRAAFEKKRLDMVFYGSVNKDIMTLFIICVVLV